jgi:hypothetical protein
MSKQLGRKPDYRLKFMNKLTEEKGTLGGAWRNEDGSISLVLNAKVMVQQNVNEVLMLFPCSKESEP